MKELFWIQKYRQHIFAIEILVAILFGPVLAKHMGASTLMTILIVIGVFILLEVSVAVFRIAFAKSSLVKTRKTHEKMQAAHQEIKKEYTQMTGERIDNFKQLTRKKKRKPRGKKTHRI